MSFYERLRFAILTKKKADVQYDIGCFAIFQGEELKKITINVNTDNDFLKQAELLAQATDRFGIPYLLGEKNDFEAIKEMMKKRGEPELKRIKEMQQNILRNMPSVRQEWIMPEDEMPQ